MSTSTSTYHRQRAGPVGKFKIPFGLDQLTGVTQNDFVYRSLGANYLAPSRDIGGMVHGRFFKRGLSYWAGVFKHDGDNARSKKIQGGDDTFAGRVTGTPFRPLTSARARRAGDRHGVHASASCRTIRSGRTGCAAAP